MSGSFGPYLTLRAHHNSMNYKTFFNLSLAILNSSFFALADLFIPDKQLYVVGGWSPGTAESFLVKWRPVLETYLTQEVGQLYNPPISFKLIPVDFDENSLSQYMIESGKVDFICKCPLTMRTGASTQFLTRMQTILPGHLHVLNRNTGNLRSLLTMPFMTLIRRYSPMATQRQMSVHKESGAIGSLVYSLKNGPVQSLAEIRGRRVGVGQLVGVGAFQLAFEVKIGSYDSFLLY